MIYKVEFTKKAKKDIDKLDSYTRTIILKWIKKHLFNVENPRFDGKALKGDKADYWRYRVGDYRIIAEIHDDKLIILLIEIGHRKEIYK